MDRALESWKYSLYVSTWYFILKLHKFENAPMYIQFQIMYSEGYKSQNMPSKQSKARQDKTEKKRLES